MYSDSHVHTEFSGDSDTPVRAQIEAAAALGMEAVWITDHHDFDVDSGDTDFNLDVERYLSVLKELQEVYKGQIELRIGIEFGQQPHLAEYEQEFFSKYEFDFVIGSTHFVNGCDPYYPSFFEGRTETEAYEDYFRTLAGNLKRFDNYDTAAHLDYVVRYGPNQNREYNFQRYQDYLDEILRTIIAKGKGLECNTAGLRYGLGETNPCVDVLRRYRELGGEILTIGSDAHISRDVGFGFDRIGEMLRNCGFEYYASFVGRKAVFHRL